MITFDITCPNEDCEEQNEVSVKLYSGSKPTRDDPGEDDYGEIAEKPDKCWRCGTSLDAVDDRDIIERAFEKAKQDHDDFIVDRHLSRLEDRAYWNGRS